ncbi:MAG: hypothetical protein MRZ10_04015, partial [Methanomassiliicoccales archaeon]|nr:hypothetical protein [Methanomassiliicoccales archaeon]
FKQHGVFACPFVLPIEQLIVDFAPEYAHDDAWSFVYLYNPLVLFSLKNDNPLIPVYQILYNPLVQFLLKNDNPLVSFPVIKHSLSTPKKIDVRLYALTSPLCDH